MKINLEKLSIDKIQAGFKSGDFTSLELTREYLKRIKKDKTNSFLSINPKAEEEAKKADQRLKNGKPTILTGIPLAVKDIILVKDLKATGGSKILENYTASYTATAVQRLKDAGMIILGKTNCDEFAMGSSNENSAYGPVLNPHDITRVSGGSSGGSAVAVANNLAPVSLGTDTGGSIRQPASFCGITGLKPSYGRVSRYGSMAMTSSLDQIGPFANNVKDLSYILHYMAGFDKKDATSSREGVSKLSFSKKKYTIGIPKEYFGKGIDKEVKDKIEESIKLLKDNGYIIKKVSLPYTDYALAAYYLLMPAEVSSNLARYDGILYGKCGKKNMSLEQWYSYVRSNGFGSEVKRRIILGTYILSAGYYDAYYKKAQKIRTLIKKDFSKVFRKVDILLTPATPTTAFKIGEKINDPMQMYLSDVFTVGANIAGITALVLPIGKDNNNLPIGLQLLGNSFKENDLFSLASFLESKIKIWVTS